MTFLHTHTHTHTEKGSDLRRVMRCRVVAQGGGDATLGGGVRSAWLWWHPMVQGLEAASSGAGAQCGVGWWHGVRRRDGTWSSRLLQCLAVELQ
jgi:hypothetical protein